MNPKKHKKDINFKVWSNEEEKQNLATPGGTLYILSHFWHKRLPDFQKLLNFNDTAIFNRG